MSALLDESASIKKAPKKCRPTTIGSKQLSLVQTNCWSKRKFDQKKVFCKQILVSNVDLQAGI